MSYELNITELKEALDMAKEVNKPLLVLGAAGSGKSKAVEQFASNFKDGLVDIRLSQMDAVDIIGVPVPTRMETGELRSVFTTPNIFPTKEDWEGVILLDECYSDDTEVMTDKGFVKFPELTEEHLVAQYDSETKGIKYVKPSRYIKKPYNGKLIECDSQVLNYCVTPNHDMAIHRKSVKSGIERFIKVKAKDVSVAAYNKFQVAGIGEGSKKHLTVKEKFAIAFQADGSIKYDYTEGTAASKALFKVNYGVDQNENSCSVSFGFSKSKKIEQFEKDFSEEYVYKKHNFEGKGEMTDFYVPNVDKNLINKDFSKIFDVSKFSAEAAKEFLEYVRLWDGFELERGGFGYSNTNKGSCDFVQQLAVVAGYRSNLLVSVDDRKESYKDCYKVHIYPNKDKVSGMALRNNVKEVDYNGFVYCVTVDTGFIIVRRNGKPLVCGNCTNASHIVQQASYQLCLDRKLNDYTLPKGAVIVAAGNEAEHGGGSNGLLAPLLNRFIVVRVKPDLNQWIEDYAPYHNVHPVVVQYLKANPDDFFTYERKQDEENQSFATARSWEVVSNMLWKCEGRGIGKIEKAMIAGTVGDEIVPGLTEMYHDLNCLPEINLILEGRLKEFEFQNASYIFASAYAGLAKILSTIKEDDVEVVSKKVANYVNFFLDNKNVGHNTDLCVGMVVKLMKKTTEISPSIYQYITNECKDIMGAVEEYKQLLAA